MGGDCRGGSRGIIADCARSGGARTQLALAIAGGLYLQGKMAKKVKVVRYVDVEALGRAGGLATAENRTPEERQAAARKAIEARWAKYYNAHPEKLKTRRPRRVATASAPKKKK
jgi:hypothetical protein